MSKFNRKGEFHLSFWWVFSWVFVVGVIIIATVMFYGKPMDVREAESMLIADKISRCLFEKGVFEINEIKNNNLYSLCGFDREAFGVGSYFYAYTAIWDYDTSTKLQEFSIGQNSYLNDCEVTGKDIKATNYPRCTYRNESFNYIDDDVIKEGIIQIITASNQYYSKSQNGGENE